MEDIRNKFMKRAAVIVMAFVMVFSTVITAAPAKAATTSENAFIVKSFTMQKGEKWTLNVYNAGSKAKISYKSNKKAVAAVNKKGVVTAKKKGKAVITVTIKEGKKTYKAKTKITVKNAITYAEALKRVNAELNLVYAGAVELAEMNGWMDSEEVVEYLVGCTELMEGVNQMTADIDEYSDEDIAEALEAIDTMLETLDELLPYLAESAN